MRLAEVTGDHGTGYGLELATVFSKMLCTKAKLYSILFTSRIVRPVGLWSNHFLSVYTNKPYDLSYTDT